MFRNVSLVGSGARDLMGPSFEIEKLSRWKKHARNFCNKGKPHESSLILIPSSRFFFFSTCGEDTSWRERSSILTGKKKITESPIICLYHFVFLSFCPWHDRGLTLFLLSCGCCHAGFRFIPGGCGVMPAWFTCPWAISSAPGGRTSLLQENKIWLTSESTRRLRVMGDIRCVLCNAWCAVSWTLFAFFYYKSTVSSEDRPGTTSKRSALEQNCGGKSIDCERKCLYE